MKNAPSRVKTTAPAANSSCLSNHAEKSCCSKPGHLQKEISTLAYQYFVERGCIHGFDKQDWHRAEEEIRKKHST